jgi:hypothetical protein
LGFIKDVRKKLAIEYWAGTDGFKKRRGLKNLSTKDSKISEIFLKWGLSLSSGRPARGMVKNPLRESWELRHSRGTGASIPECLGYTAACDMIPIP